jgi:serine/threonine-protein kinase RsbW
VVPFKKSEMHSEKLLKQFRLQVKTELPALTVVLQWFEQVAKPLLPEKCFWQCQVALAEGFTNTVRYAHQHLPSTTPIDLEVNLFVHYLEMRIWDWGKPFDLQAKLNYLRQSNEDPLEKENDRGLFFMQELTDDLQYVRISNRRNCLVMHKKL